jgi:hypothetical protein
VHRVTLDLGGKGGHAQGLGDQPDLEPATAVAFTAGLGHRQARAVDGDVALGEHVAHPGRRHGQAQHAVVLGPPHLRHRRHEVDVARQRVAADLGAIARGAFDVEHAALDQPAQRRERQALLHHIEHGVVGARARGDREAHAVDGDAGADGQPVVEPGRQAQREAAQAGAVFDLPDAGHALDDASEHGR